MVVIGGRYLLIAVGVVVAWRIFCWRRNGLQPAREGVIALLSAWSLVVVWLTFFPMNIILYSWHGTLNLIPLVSTIDLVRYGVPGAAFTNIVGNILLFLPFGLLLPALFAKLRRPWPLLWRVAIISVVIELLQMVTRARATDVDDVVLNVLGAGAGLGLFSAGRALFRRLPRYKGRTDRVVARSGREPLLLALVPVAVGVMLTAVAVVPAVVSQTIGEGEMLREVTSDSAGASVVARADIDGHVLLLVRSSGGDGETLLFSEYKQVLPGRYVMVAKGDPLPGEGSFSSWGATTYDPTAGEVPVFWFWGRNEAGAAWLVARPDDGSGEHRLPVGEYFMVGFSGVTDSDGRAPWYTATFVDADGQDVSQEFTIPGEAMGVANPAIAEEYAVWDALLRDAGLADELEMHATGRRLAVIQTPTDLMLPDLFESEVARGMRSQYPDLGEEIYGDFEAMNGSPADLEPLFVPDFEYVIADVSSIFNAGADGWRSFYEAYPDADGLLTLSRVGFDRDMNNALVCISYYHSGIGGAGKYVLLTKVEGRWTIRGGYGLWIS